LREIFGLKIRAECELKSIKHEQVPDEPT